MAGASSQDATPQSYTSMHVGDVEAIGAHCQLSFCRQLDFLPFRCESCQGTYCLDHRSETAHKCPKAGAWARARREASSNTPSLAPRPDIYTHEQQCSSLICKTLVGTALNPGVRCPNCHHQYCLKHRMREDHGCTDITFADASSSSSRKKRGLVVLERLKAWGAGKRAAASSLPSFNKPRRAPTTAATISMLKRTAKGDVGVAPEKRVYLHVEASADATTARHPTGAYFYSVDWSVGRVLDVAAKALRVENVNNRGDGEDSKLRIFYVEGGRLLDFSERIGTACTTGNTIVLLRGVCPPVPDLIQA